MDLNFFLLLLISLGTLYLVMKVYRTNERIKKELVLLKDQVKELSERKEHKINKLQEEEEEEEYRPVDEMEDVFKENSPLTEYTDYRVGNSGLSKKNRERELLRLISMKINNSAFDTYYIQWGTEDTKDRVSAIITFLQMRKRNAENRTSADMTETILNYQQDIDFLHSMLDDY